MRCKHHPDIRTDELCDLCAQPICSDCITEVHETRHCPECYMRVSQVPGTGPTVCHEAKSALMFAILSLFCAGQFLGPIAIYKGIKARKRIILDSTITGEGRANAAILIGVIGFCFWLYASVILATNQSNQQPRDIGHMDIDYIERLIEDAESLQTQNVEDPAQALGNLEQLAEDMNRELAKHSASLKGESSIVSAAGTVIGQLLIQSVVDETAILFKFAEAGGIEPTSLTTSMAFRYRRQLLAKLVEQMDYRDELIRTISGRFKNELRSNGIESPSLEQYTAAYVRGMQVDLLLKRRKIKKTAINDVKTVLDLLEQNHEQWTVDDSGSIQFADSSPDLSEQYTQLLVRLEESEQQENRLFEQYIANTKRLLDKHRKNR